MKKLLLGICLASLACLPLFADYKTEYSWNITDEATIDKCLSEAKEAKNETYIKLWSEQKLLVGKNSKNTSYEELKKLISCKRLAGRVILDNRFNKDFTKNVLSDKDLCDVCKQYIKKYYAARSVGFVDKDVWRNNFMNIASLIKVNNIYEANLMFKNYRENISIFLSDTEVKDDLKIMKRAWYPNISKSEEWKKLLVEIELVSKSLE